MSEALANGISRYTLYALRDKGIITPVSRGIYRLAELPAIGNPDMAIVGLRFPHAVICLVSALAYHGITTQIPHRISIAIPRNTYLPSPDYPPLLVHRFSMTCYQTGIETHLIDNIPVRIYSQEKTIADCFKFRNKIGMDVIIEALKLYRSSSQYNPVELLRHASTCRVATIMHPYLEAIL
jgi:predicted transcriptional regulator of viral defense system